MVLVVKLPEVDLPIVCKLKNCLLHLHWQRFADVFLPDTECISHAWFTRMKGLYCTFTSGYEFIVIQMILLFLCTHMTTCEWWLPVEVSAAVSGYQNKNNSEQENKRKEVSALQAGWARSWIWATSLFLCHHCNTFSVCTLPMSKNGQNWGFKSRTSNLTEGRDKLT